MLRTVLPLSLTAAVLLCPPAASQEAPPPGYDVEAFLRLTTFGDLALSPDGETLAFVASRDDFEEDRTVSSVWLVVPGGDDPEPRRVTWEEGSYSDLRWSPDGTRLAFLSTRGEGDAAHLFLLDRGPGDPRPVTDEEGFPEGVRAWDWEPDGGGFAVVTTGTLPDSVEALYGDVLHYGGPQPGSEIHRVRLPEGADAPESTRVATLEEAITDVRVHPSDGRLLVTRGPPTEPEVHLGAGDLVELGLLGPGDGAVRYLTDNHFPEGQPRWSRDGERIFVSSGFGHPDSARIVMSVGRIHALDPATGDFDELGTGYDGAIQSYVQAEDGALLALASMSTGTDLVEVDPASGEATVVAAFPDRVYGLTTGGGAVAFARSTADAFDEIWWAPDRGRVDDARPITDLNGELTAQARPHVETFTWENGDGQTIEGILYWPPGQQGRQGLPTMVDIHGGPWSARTAAIAPTGGGWAYYPALLASRGYLVLEPNYRGGTGRGLEFLRAIEGYSCSRPADDVLSGVDALVERGWADPGRLGVMGYSYGGLMTNCLIGRTDRFEVAVSGAGLWNDASYFGSSDNYGQTDIRYDGRPPWEDPEAFWEESPISRAGEIETPTLIVFGAADRRVPLGQGLELYRALRYRGVPSELLVFPGQGHGFTRPEHKLKKVRAELEWIDSYLKGEGRRLVWD